MFLSLHMLSESIYSPINTTTCVAKDANTIMLIIYVFLSFSSSKIILFFSVQLLYLPVYYAAPYIVILFTYKMLPNNKKCTLYILT